MTPETAPKPVAFPGIGHSLLLMLLAFLLTVFLAVPIAVVDLVFHVKLSGNAFPIGYANLVAVGAVIAIAIDLSKTPWREALPFKPVRPLLLLPIIISTLGAGVLLSEIDNHVRSVFPPPAWLEQFIGDFFGGKEGLWGSLFALSVVAPLTEECLFRGVILRGMLSRYSKWAAVVITSVLFALIHGNIWQLASAAALGLLYGWWFLRTGSLVPGVVGHAFNNGLIVVVLYLPFQIPGFNTHSAFHPAVEFQPLWLDLSGLAFLGLGIWLFVRLSRRDDGARIQ